MLFLNQLFEMSVICDFGSSMSSSVFIMYSLLRIIIESFNSKQIFKGFENLKHVSLFSMH